MPAVSLAVKEPKIQDAIKSQKQALPQVFTIQDENLRRSLAGAVAGLVASVLVCPLDVVKIRIQNEILQPGQKGEYGGPFLGLSKIRREEGTRGLFRGLGTTTIAYIADRALWFTSYNRIKEHLAISAGRSPDDAGSWIHLNASVAASLLTMALVNPLWVVRTRTMMQTGKPKPGTHHYSSTLDALQKIVKNEGFRALYKGFTPSLLGISHVAVQFPLYEQLKRMMHQYELKAGRSEADLTATSILLASAGSKMIASVITYPHEVLRTRLQTQSTQRHITHIPDKICVGPNCPPDTQPPPKQPKYSGLVQATQVIMKEEGWRALYRGLGTNLIRTVPASALSLWAYEVLVQKLDPHDCA
ncbi:mitochondrial carrier domain-containing protein [Phlyctochytrium arcticum]|nr:mitochondrial carrier domain-containing protein [Phlyctochytrium arcticum]